MHTKKTVIAAGTKETLTALEESFSDLTDDRLHAFPIAGRNNIAWIVMHCLVNLDVYCNVYQGGKQVLEEWESRWQYGCERPKLGDPFPTGEQLRNLFVSVRAETLALLGAATDQDLERKRSGRAEEPSGDCYLRMIGHTNTHIRQIWLLRGALGLTHAMAWPQQHEPGA
ncbi:MAG TPA: DinB family protein [Phycisphaerae bacterium]|nr:DinB family protein [Phycisphaerae bacterium]